VIYVKKGSPGLSKDALFSGGLVAALLALKTATNIGGRAGQLSEKTLVGGQGVRRRRGGGRGGGWPPKRGAAVAQKVTLALPTRATFQYSKRKPISRNEPLPPEKDIYTIKKGGKCPGGNGTSAEKGII